jgi:hypothetical protein
MFARITIFQGKPDSVDGSMRFPVGKASKGLPDLPGFWRCSILQTVKAAGRPS